MNSTYQVNEYFFTIQGEGEHVGRSSFFLRLQGCPVGCPWCDSKTTWHNGGTSMTLREISDAIAAFPESELITITGGEPLLFDLDKLLRMLRMDFPKRKIDIETSGQFPFRGEERPDHVTCSPKYGHGLKNRQWFVHDSVMVAMTWPNSGEFKYVVDDDWVPIIVYGHKAQWVSNNGTEAFPPVRLMPEGCPPSDERVAQTIEYLKSEPTWRFGARLQYAYPAIEKMEGANNKVITAEEAMELTRQRRKEQGRVISVSASGG